MADIIVTTLLDEAAETDPDTGAFTGDIGSETADGDGLSLREAVQLAQNGDRILFANDLNGVMRIDGVLATIGVAANVSIYGDDRITISGDVSNDDIVANGLTDALATRASGNFSDNQKIFFLANSVTDVLIDGLTLTGARGNSYGGAIDAYGSALTIQGSTIAGNIVYSGPGGGAIYTGADLTIEDSTFFGNIATDGNAANGHGGGAIFTAGGRLSVRNTTFTENQALNGTGAGAASGGAIFASSDVYLNNVTMTGNQAEFQGGGLFASNGAANPMAPLDDVAIFNSIILGNNAGAMGPGANVEIDGNDPSAFTIGNSITSTADGAVTGVFAETQTLDVANSASTFTAGVLADNGGPVQTVALLNDPLNPAIGGGTLNARLSDARGLTRYSSDLGAYELPSSANFIVTSLDDDIDATDGVITLREAVLAANGQSGANTITFAAGLSGRITLTQGELSITDSVTILGDGRITISGDANGDDIVDGDGFTDVDQSKAAPGDRMSDNSRIFVLTGDDNTSVLDGLTLNGGHAVGDFRADDGGAIYADVKAITISNSTITGNYAMRDGGGVYIDAVDTATLKSVTISNNRAGADGGGVYADGDDVTISNSTITGNAAEDEGGGVYLHVSTVIFTSSVPNL